MADFPSNQRLFIPRSSDASIRAKRESAKSPSGPRARNASVVPTCSSTECFEVRSFFAHEDPDLSVLADERTLCTWRIAEAACELG